MKDSNGSQNFICPRGHKVTVSKETLAGLETRLLHLSSLSIQHPELVKKDDIPTFWCNECSVEYKVGEYKREEETVSVPASSLTTGKGLTLFAHSEMLMLEKIHENEEGTINESDFFLWMTLNTDSFHLPADIVCYDHPDNLIRSGYIKVSEDKHYSLTKKGQEYLSELKAASILR